MFIVHLLHSNGMPDSYEGLGAFSAIKLLKSHPHSHLHLNARRSVRYQMFLLWLARVCLAIDEPRQERRQHKAQESARLTELVEGLARLSRLFNEQTTYDLAFDALVAQLEEQS